MKKKLILFCALALLVSAALGACGQGSKSSDTQATETASSDNGSDTDTTADDGTLSATEPNISSDGTPTAGGSVVVGMTQDLVSLDPHETTDAGTRSVVFNMYEGLVKATSDGDLEPAVASSYVISEDATCYTFTLRDGILFSDGTAVTVEDIKYSIERYARLQGETSSFAQAVDSVVIDDENTVSIYLTEANSEFLAQLTVAIIPASNDDPAGNPIGTGPFRYVSYSVGQNLILERNEYYWGDLAYLDQVEFKFIADTETAFTQLLAGTIDILNYLTTSQVQTLETQYSDQFNVVEGSMHLVHALFLNNDCEPLDNVLVRQALCYAIDRDEINNFLFGGASEIIGSHMIPALTTWYEESTADMYTYDVEKAKELLAEAGYADGFDLTISVPSSYSQHVDTAQIIASQLEAVGINVTIEEMEWTSWYTDVYRGRNYQATVISFDGDLNPSDWLARYQSDASNNFFNYSNEEYDSLLEQALATIDTDEKAELYKQMQINLAENAAAVYIEDPADFVAVSVNYDGYVFYPTSAWDMSTVYLISD
ncbi:MAG: ABC transporter substrate-binding protein [Lachnospiraceae bacterium]|nr:ABC transporter substrate-binding protein [Lachnospiraceae bacterium]